MSPILFIGTVITAATNIFSSLTDTSASSVKLLESMGYKDITIISIPYRESPCSLLEAGVHFEAHKEDGVYEGHICHHTVYLEKHPTSEN